MEYQKMTENDRDNSNSLIHEYDMEDIKEYFTTKIITHSFKLMKEHPYKRIQLEDDKLLKAFHSSINR